MQAPTLMDQLAAHVKHGDHLCVICENAEDRLNAAVQYIADGLRLNEFVMYAADPETTGAICERLVALGIDVDHEKSRGALNLPTADDAYLQAGKFDPDYMYAAFDQAISNALAAGYSGCRFAGEPLWAINREELRPGLIEFEARLNNLFKHRKAAGLCVYDKKAWPASVVRDVLRTHPVAVVDDLICHRNLYYEKPDLIGQEVGADLQVNWMLSQLRALRTHEARLQVALDAGRLGNWELDLTTDTSIRSKRHDEIFGYDRPVPNWGYELFMQHVLPEDRAHVDTAFRQAIEKGATWQFECRIRRQNDGAVRWIEAHGRPAPEGSAGKPVRRLLGIVADITERKEMEQALRDADRRKDEFLATLAHELRNPLAPISNVLHLMKLKYADDEQLLQMHGVIDRQITHLTRLVDDLLEISRITTGRIMLHRERLELSKVLTNALESAQPTIEACGHHFSMSMPEAPIYLDGDATRLAQVFLNLLNNAAKYTPKGGRIDVIVEEMNDEVLVRVRDNGAGLAPELIPEMFKMFVQGHRVGERAQGGLGIGLPLAKQLLELHGGSITAMSAGLGYGSEFVVTLPLAPAQQPRSAAPAADTASLGKRRILVVDDNVDAADTLAASLGFFGHAVKTCYDGATALEAAKQFEPDIVILDIGLPGMDGYEVARRLRAMNTSAKLVALTGWGQTKDRQLAYDAGFDVHRTKPVNPVELLSAVAASSPTRTGPRDLVN